MITQHVPSGKKESKKGEQHSLTACLHRHLAREILAAESNPLSLHKITACLTKSHHRTFSYVLLVHQAGISTRLGGKKWSLNYKTTDCNNQKNQLWSLPGRGKWVVSVHSHFHKHMDKHLLRLHSETSSISQYLRKPNLERDLQDNSFSDTVVWPHYHPKILFLILEQYSFTEVIPWHLPVSCGFWLCEHLHSLRSQR